MEHMHLRISLKSPMHSLYGLVSAQVLIFANVIRVYYTPPTMTIQMKDLHAG